MLIIKIEPIANNPYHALEERHGATENWMGEDWLVVPDELREAVWDCLGCCDLVIEEGELVDVEPKEQPPPPEPPEPVPSELEEIQTILKIILTGKE